MKTNPLVIALLGMLCVGAVVTFLLAWGFEMNFRRLQLLQRQEVAAQATRNWVDLLANDALEYSKRNPAIDPILQAAHVKFGKPVAQPAPKAQTK